MLRKKAVMKELKSAGGAPSVSHLLFADDSLILIRAKEDATHLQEILDLYEHCSRQVVNKGKSAVLFSANTSSTDKEVKQKLQTEKETLNER